MNKDILKGKWKQLKGSAQSKWGKLTDDDLDRVEGEEERLAGLLQEKYGMTREEAHKEIDAWMGESDKSSVASSR